MTALIISITNKKIYNIVYMKISISDKSQLNLKKIFVINLNSFSLSIFLFLNYQATKIYSNKYEYDKKDK